MNVILLGPPGAGKGTQAKRLAAETGIVHVSSGDLFRAALGAGTELGMKAKAYMDAGELVPDSLVIDMILERINQSDCREGGVLFDGFPRTAAQAQALEEALATQKDRIDAVLLFEVPDDVLVKRVSGRIASKSTGEIYNRFFNPPRDAEGNDISDNEDFYQRPDDNAETVINRLKVYHSQTEPLIDYYDNKGLLHKVDGDRDTDTVHNVILNKLHLNGAKEN